MAEPACNTSLDARVAEIQHLKIARVDEMPNFEVQYLNKTRRSRLKVARFELGDGLSVTVLKSQLGPHGWPAWLRLGLRKLKCEAEEDMAVEEGRTRTVEQYTSS